MYVSTLPDSNERLVVTLGLPRKRATNVRVDLLPRLSATVKGYKRSYSYVNTEKPCLFVCIVRIGTD